MASPTNIDCGQSKPSRILFMATTALSMVFIDQTVVSVSLPTIADDLGMSPELTQWVLNGYVLSLAVFVGVSGRLSDSFGHVVMFRTGVMVFVLGSIGSGFALTPEMMLVSRGVQGLGAALLLPSSATLVMNAFSNSGRGRAMATYLGIAELFLVIGPLAGGAITEYSSWRFIFLINIPVGATVIYLLQRSRLVNDRRPGSHVDWVGAIMLILGLAGLVVGLQQTGIWGAWSWLVIALGVALLASFVRKELAAQQPYFNLRLFADVGLRGDAIAALCIQVALVPATLWAALYLQDILRFSPIEAGLSYLPFLLPMIATTFIAGKLYDRVGGRLPIVIGMSAMAVGLALVAALMPRENYWLLVPGLALFGVGLGLSLSPANTDALVRAGTESRGAISGLMQTIRQTGAALGVALIATIVLSTTAAGVKPDSSQIALGYAVCASIVATGAILAFLLIKSRPHESVADA